MSAVWFTSDTHFNHSKIAQHRGFASAEEHDETIIRRWNARVHPDDVVWHLGDVGMGSFDRFGEQVHRLNGRLHLVTGNHDECAPGVFRDSHNRQPYWMAAFLSIQPFARRKINGRTVLLSHYPYKGDHTDEDRCTQWRLRDEGDWLLHGHTHSAQSMSIDHPRQIHVGVDAWGFEPVPLSTLRDFAMRDVLSFGGQP